MTLGGSMSTSGGGEFARLTVDVPVAGRQPHDGGLLHRLLDERVHACTLEFSALAPLARAYSSWRSLRSRRAYSSLRSRRAYSGERGERSAKSTLAYRNARIPSVQAGHPPLASSASTNR